MRLLALETSTEYCSCAILTDSGMIERVEHAGQRHSALLLPMTERLLAEAGTSVAQLDGIAFGAGPGSFTGLRIGCSVAQGLALAGDLPVVPVVTLEALAEDSGCEHVLACLDARMGELYIAAYRMAEGHWQASLAPQIAHPQALPPLAGFWAGRGSGFAVHSEALSQAYRFEHIDAQAFPRARAVAVLGARALAAGAGVDAGLAGPLYLRDKVALDVREQAAARAARKAA